MQRTLLSLLLLTAGTPFADAATAIATYQFNNTMVAEEPGVPLFTPVAPLGGSGFVSDVVFGQARQVWEFDGDGSPAGLFLNTTGVISPTSYSVDLVFLFTERDSNWRRIIDVENRQSDNGFYVNTSNNLAVYPISGSSASWTNNAYHHVVLTNDGTQVQGYIDGVAEFTAATSVMNLNNANNPGLLMHFFADNLAGGGPGESSDGRVALIRFWNGVLTSDEAHTLATNPFIPEPASWILAAIPVALGLARRRSSR